MRHEKTEAIIQAAREVLAAYHPQTLRQCFYQLVSRQVVENTRGAYQGLSDALRDARIEEIIPWEWIEDRIRQPHAVPQWKDLADFVGTVKRSYRRDVWARQARYLEVWLEKDALSGIFADVLRPYGVTLNVGRGFDGWSSIHDASTRFISQLIARPDRDGGTILYFGDWDPSGVDMDRSLRDRLAELGALPEIKRCAICAEDIETFHLPPAMAKKSDSRSAAFIEEHGNACVELDALPAVALEERIQEEVVNIIDTEALDAVRETEGEDMAKLEKALEGI